MKHLRLFGVTILAVFILSAIAAGTAAAEEKTKVLPEPTAAKPLTSSAKGTEGFLETEAGLRVTCKSNTGTGSGTSPNLGSYTTLFTECKGPLSTVCTTTGDPAGLIANSGEVHFLLGLNAKSELIGVLAFLVKEFEFNCTKTGVEDKVKALGCIAALAEVLNKLVKETKDVFSLTEPGKANIKLILPPEATKESECLFLAKIGTKPPFEPSGLTGTVVNSTFKQSEKAVEVLLMNPTGL